MALARRVLGVAPMKSALVVAVSVVSLSCGLDVVEEAGASSQAMQGPGEVVGTQAFVGRWNLGPNTIHGALPEPGTPAPTSPYASLTISEDGSFALYYGGGCVLQGISGTWQATGALLQLHMTPNDWQTWPGGADGTSSNLRPTLLLAQLAQAQLHVTGFDEKSAPVDQLWARYAQ